MNGLYHNVELRKLPPRFRTKLSQILDSNEDWKKLMACIPSTRHPTVSKYKSEHIDLIERHALNSRKSCAEILLDEWSTSGQARPTVETLYELLQECQLYRAADYVAEEILEVGPPPRPLDGPARRISSNDDEIDLTSVAVREITPNFDAETSFSHNNASAASTKLLQDSCNMERLLEELNNYNHERANLISFNIKTLREATNSFSEKFTVGSGSFGTVYKLQLGPSTMPLAIKLLHPTSSVIEEQFITEINVLSRYRHENLVSLIGYCTNGPQYCLIYEFMSGGTLMDALASQHSVLSWSKRFEIMLGIGNGISYLHAAYEKPLIHRDIKSANILLTPSHKPKIGDFGLAKSFSTTGAQTSALASTIFGTSAYMAPEAFRGDISPKMDVFSFGVILLEVLTGLSPYDQEREGNDIVTYLEESIDDNNILPWLDKKPGVLNSECATGVYQIALKCLSDKKRRPTSQELVQNYQTLMQYNCGKNF